MTSEIGHVMDIMATCVDLAYAEYPTTYKGHDILPMEGKSLLPIFKAGQRKGHDYLGFEHFNERAFLDSHTEPVAHEGKGNALDAHARLPVVQ